MSAWDYVMPHRLLINRSLRREAEKLRARVDACQIEYDRKVGECEAQLERIAADQNREEELLKSGLAQKLGQRKEILTALREDVVQYTEHYLHRRCLYQVQDIKRKEAEILQEEELFLGEQMAYIGVEIETLKKRQDELTALANVEDIIWLAVNSGCMVDFREGDDAVTLLTKVSVAIDACGNEKKLERFALMRLKEMIQERSDYLPTIQYVSWVIRQKIRYSRQLASKRAKIRRRKKEIQKESAEIKAEIRKISGKLEEMAGRIRFYWAKPLTYLGGEISYAYQEKNSVRDRLRSVGGELHRMASEHANDQDRWEQLQEERKELSSNMNDLQETISEKKDERKKWFEKRDYILQLCTSYQAPILMDKRNGLSDEERIIHTRLAEIRKIRKEGAAEAERIYQEELAQITEAHEKQTAEILQRKEKLIARLENAKKTFAEMQRKEWEASGRLEQCKKDDDRIFLMKWFSESPEVSHARLTLAYIQDSLAHMKEKERSLQAQLEQQAAVEAVCQREFERKRHQCVPKYLRPNAAELHEESILELRKKEIEERKGREGGRGRKN